MAVYLWYFDLLMILQALSVAERNTEHCVEQYPPVN